MSTGGAVGQRFSGSAYGALDVQILAELLDRLALLVVRKAEFDADAEFERLLAQDLRRHRVRRAPENLSFDEEVSRLLDDERDDLSFFDRDVREAADARGAHVVEEDAAVGDLFGRLDHDLGAHPIEGDVLALFLSLL